MQRRALCAGGLQGLQHPACALSKRQAEPADQNSAAHLTQQGRAAADSVHSPRSGWLLGAKLLGIQLHSCCCQQQAAG